MNQEKKKIHEILWKSRVRVETITFLRFFRAAYLKRGPRTIETVAFFRIPTKISMSGTWNFSIIERNIKAIFREYFSSWRDDSGKIFKLMTFRRRPRKDHILYWSKSAHYSQWPSVPEKRREEEFSENPRIMGILLPRENEHYLWKISLQ